jgi:hypothetical protein
VSSRTNWLIALLLITTLAACDISPKPVEDKKPKGTAGHTPKKVSPPLPPEEQPRALAASYCTCQEEVFAKFGKKIDIYTATPVSSLSTDALIQTFREVKDVNERFIQQLKICGNEISHHVYFKPVTTNDALAEKFGNEMEACMTPLEAKFAPKLKAWNTYLDAIGKTQHEQLELYKLEVDKRAGK